MKDNLKKIVAVGLYIPGTGFTRVLDSLFGEMCNYFDIHWVGIAYTGPVIEKEEYIIYPNNLAGGDMYGAYYSVELANQIEAHAILILNDFWILKNYRNSFKNLKSSILKLAYIPLDGKIVDPSPVQDVCFLDKIVMYTDFAAKQTIRAFKKLITINQKISFPEVNIIPHGIDLLHFKPMSKAVAKNLCFKNIDRPSESIFILNANRPVERKGLHLTIEGFAKALPKCKQKTYLVLHHGDSNEFQRNNLNELLKKYKIEDQVIFNPLKDHGYVSDEQLNLLYNACDIGLNSSYGEGWGLISFEHGATRSVQITPNHTACKELWKNHGLLVQTRKDKYFDSNPFLMSEIDPADLAAQITNLVNNASLRDELAEKAYKNATKRKYAWKNIAECWLDLINTPSKK